MCEVCGEPSTRRLERDNGVMIWTGDFCDECYARELGPETDKDVAALKTLEQRGGDTAMLNREAEELVLRARVYPPLSEEARVLVARYGFSSPSV